MANVFSQNNVVEITPESPYYPKEWKTLSNAPEKLYCIGDVALLNTRRFAIVGSRKTSTLVAKLGESIAETLSYSFTLVTGVADGGDSAVIEGAMKGSGKVICVLAGGFSSLPQTNFSLLQRAVKKGLFLSPYPYDTPVRVFSYEYRNKILARLAEGTLVLSAGEKSGALITAKYTALQQKQVFALPYAPNSAGGKGCNDLIKKGAKLVENASDVLNFYGLSVQEKSEEKSLSDTEEKTLSALRDIGECHVAELSEKAGIPLFTLRAVLSALEIKGLVLSVGGNRYASI